MKQQLLLAVAIGAALIGCNQQASEPAAEAGIALDSEERRVSYGMGIGLGQRIRQESFSVDVDAFAEGVKHAVNGVEPLMNEEQIRQEMQAFQQKQIAKQQEAMQQAADANQAKGKAFLAENGAKEGVVTTESGLQYSVITAGTGAKPTATDTVEVHYRGTLIDGTEFDSSYKRGATVSFPVNGVIPGWTEALQLMPTGSKWQLVIPSDLAYGPGGTGGGPIGPNETLIFEVELVSIKAAESEQGAEEK
jgi:FKBP-type peptidyl-prolyl cis-trans isomerase